MAWRRVAESDGFDATIDIPAEDVPYVEVALDLDASSLLDMLIFYDRLYFATDGGLFSLGSQGIEVNNRVHRPELRVSDPYYSASAGLGAVAASCGSKGLRLLLHDFDSEGRGTKSTKAAGESLRAELGYGSVVNFKSLTDYEFLVGATEKGPRGENILISTRRASKSFDGPSERLIEQDPPDYVLWDRSRLLVFVDGQGVSVGVDIRSDARPLGRSRTVVHYGGVLGSVLSAAVLKGAVSIEGEHAVAVVADNDETAVAPTGAVISMRTYPRSHRYKRLVTVTSETGLWMIGVGPDRRDAN